MPSAVEFVNVFTCQGQGGNPCRIVLDAGAMAPAAMQAAARRFGHEAGFVLPARTRDFAFTFRFFVPNHEMEMCGHATIGALWALARRGLLPGPSVRIDTLSGPVTGYVGAGPDGGPTVAITQPAGTVVPLTGPDTAAVLRALGIGPEALAPRPLLNAVTSRVKTLVPIQDPARLNALVSDPDAVAGVCDRIGSTGLYPYAPLDQAGRSFEARQFPRASGYPEDPATGIAAAALAFGLLHAGLIAPDDRPVRVFQGRAMGRLSELQVRIGFADGRPVGCLLAGTVTPDTRPDP
jgi:PhzF family phenazine biosynthesis protein